MHTINDTILRAKRGQRREAIAKGVIAALLFVYAILVRAYVLWYLWAWFITPLGFYQLGMVHLLGLSMVLKYFIINIDHRKDERNLWDKAAMTLFLPWLVFGSAWIAKGFM